MTEKQQIEEMLDVMVQCEHCSNYNYYTCSGCVHRDENRAYATMLYNAGYRKIDDGSVVLTTEKIAEYEKGLRERWEKDIEQARKETAKEIWKRFDIFFRPFDKKDAISIDLLLLFLENVVKQYGVEVEQQ